MPNVARGTWINVYGFMVSRNCFDCGKSGHMIKYYPMDNTQGRDSNQAHVSGPDPDALKKNCFCALRSRGDQEESLDVVPVCYKCFPLMSMFY